MEFYACCTCCADNGVLSVDDSGIGGQWYHIRGQLMTELVISLAKEISPNTMTSGVGPECLGFRQSGCKRFLAPL
ncbi:hypothetical protein TNCV_4987891 [Trichonephila clavipes]|nr:hypothetical protein TNCV_4987891 [Trichonephila clavipes]